MSVIDVIIPAFNEADSIRLVIKDIPHSIIRNIVVINNASSDKTKQNALEVGALVIDENRKGYGSACLAGIQYLSPNPPDIIVFLDADYSDHPNELKMLVDPIIDQKVDLVIGSRLLGKREKGALLPQAIFGNKLACFLIKIIYGIRFTDLGPFRAIKWEALKKLQMVDTNYGWTVEMQVKAIKQKLKITEVPVSYRKRIGISKITGTFSGTIKAGYKILFLIFKYSFSK